MVPFAGPAECIAVSEKKRVAIVGGGPAGLAAALRLRDEGAEVELFEARSRLGGRAASFFDPQAGHWIDQGQHVSMGCCTEMNEFLHRTGALDLFKPFRTLHFLRPDARRYDFQATPYLPAPLHLLPALARWNWFTTGERWKIALAMGRLVRLDKATCAGRTVGDWLSEQGQSTQTIDRFWAPVIISALSETADRASLAAAKKVFCDGFLASRAAYEVWIPQVPLQEIFDRHVGDYLKRQGVTIHRGTPVAQLDGDFQAVRQLRLHDGSTRTFDAAIVAVPWNRIDRLLTPAIRQTVGLDHSLKKIEGIPIVAAHFWFDRSPTDLPHAVLVDQTGDWFFRPPFEKRNPAAKEKSQNNATSGYYCQVVTSAARGACEESSTDFLDRVEGELRQTFPTLSDARQLRRRMTKHRRAVFSVRPESEAIRPGAATEIPNLALAGDWTDTGWPATMEGAVRSGQKAATVLLKK